MPRPAKSFMLGILFRNRLGLIGWVKIETPDKRDFTGYHSAVLEHTLLVCSTDRYLFYKPLAN